MKPKPCAVCGETNTKLIDGFYYCTECGTQEVNTQETLVETVFADGTLNISSKWKVRNALKETTQMTREWKKWHALNFIMLGLVEQLMDLGASVGFKDQVLWIWTRYMNMFMVKDEMKAIAEDHINLNKSIFMDIDENDNQQRSDKSGNDEKQDKKKENKMKTLKKSVEEFKGKILLSILYLGLLFDRSSIQLSNFLQFINEKRLSFRTCLKFIPKELDVTDHPDIVKFRNSVSLLKFVFPLQLEPMSLIKVLDLGTPPMPDVRKMIENYVTELCLPNSFKNLVLSLFLQCPTNRIEIGEINTTASISRLPHYEAEVMGYILVALKMCFGLDDDYEIKISDAVEKINDTENRLMSYKLGMHSNPTNRLFSFREWSNYLQYRHIVLCKQYLPMAVQHNSESDDYVFMEHLVEKSKKPIKLQDEITMDILNKIPPTNEGQVIPKSEFVVSLTPLSSYTEVVSRYIQDPEVKLLLSEDFTQYSLSYACEYLKLVVNKKGKSIIGGVTKENKVFNKHILGKFENYACDKKTVYVRNCENRNWFKTNPPNIEHITEIDEGTSDKDTEDGYDFNLKSELAENQVSTTEVESENTLPGSMKDTAVTYEQDELENIQEEEEYISIFDDPFDDEVASATAHNQDTEIDTYNKSFEFWTQLRTLANDKSSDLNNETSLVEAVYNPETFNRASVINELLLHACKKYKITIPIDLKRNKPDRPTKRPRKETKPETITMNKRLKSAAADTYRENRMLMQRIMSAYNAGIEKDLLNEVSEHVKSFAVMTHLDNAATQENRIADVCGDVQDDTMITNNVDVDKSKDIGTMDVNNETTALGDTEKEEIDDVDSSPNSPKVNPDFDEKTHDIKQLYIKCGDRLQLEDIFDINDPEIEKLLEEKIIEYSDKKISTPASKLRQRHDDERPNVLSDSKDTNSQEDEFDEVDIKNLPNLIHHPIATSSFGYWIRYYKSARVMRQRSMVEGFAKESKETMPKSFLFVLERCASIIHCEPFILYKRMMYIEKSLFMGTWSKHHTKKQKTKK